jgi:hypothetical protein
MAEAFPVSGNIESASFPHLLVDLHRHGATGSLKVTGPVHPKALYFRGGRILFGSSNDPRDQLGAILIESGRITREQLDEVNAKVGPGNPLAKVLAESGFVNQRELGDAARVKVERILADVLSWDSGSFEFEDGVLPKGAVDLKLSTERLLLAATQRIADRSFALRHLELSTVLEAAAEGESALSEVRAEVWPLLERLDGQRTLKDAIALTRLDEFEAAKTACAMLFLGIVRRKERGEEVDLAQEAQSGLAGEPPLRPTGPGPQPSPPAPEPTGFAFTEAHAPAFIAAEPEPESLAATVALPLTRAEPEPEPFVTASRPPELFPEVVPAEPPAIPAPTFTMDTARAHKPADTVPGDQPAYAPAAPTPTPVYAPAAPPPRAEEPPAPKLPEIEPAPPPASRPTQEDLAALDALLSPSASGRLARSPVERPRPQRWVPQSRPPTTPPRRAPARTAPSAPSRIPFIAAVLAGVALATVGAWYFFLRPHARTPLPSRAAIATPVPPPAAVAVPASPTPTMAPTVEPTPAPGPIGTPAAVPSATPTAVPPAAPTPTPAANVTPRVTPAAPVPPGDARALLVQGALPDAARSFAAAMAAGGPGRFSLQVLVACAPENVQKAVAAVPGEELFILPVNVKGRACYRLCWGVYDSRSAAEAALGGLPSYFRQGGVTPRLSPLAELLP